MVLRRGARELCSGPFGDSPKRTAKNYSLEGEKKIKKIDLHVSQVRFLSAVFANHTATYKYLPSVCLALPAVLRSVADGGGWLSSV